MPWKYDFTLDKLIWEEPFNKKEDDKYGLLGELVCIEFWKKIYKQEAFRIKITDVREIRRLFPKIKRPWVLNSNVKRTYEIDMFLNFNDKPWSFAEVEIRASWKKTDECPFIESFYILGRKDKYLGRYDPVPTYFFVFNDPFTMCLMINSRDFPKEKTIMTHDKNRGGKSEAGFLINPKCIRVLEGNFRPPPEVLKEHFPLIQSQERINEKKKQPCFSFVAG